MNPNYAADAIISSVKKSNLNFYIQETPFSLFINLRKTFINNKSGDILQSDHCETIATVKTEVEQDSIRKLETEVNETRDALCKLTVELEKAKTEASKAFSETHEAYKKVEKLENENKALSKENSDLQANVDKLKSEKAAGNKSIKSTVKELERLEIENNILEKKIEDLNIKNIKHKEDLDIKNDEVKKNIDEISSLQEKLNSLLDILYGCHECGLCDCECDHSVNEDEDCASSLSLLPECVMTGDGKSSPPDTPSQRTPPEQHHPKPSLSPWTPPPTPPCASCGGVNFGPCPSSVCFACMPPLPVHDTSSPARTPPGTPPLAR